MHRKNAKHRWNWKYSIIFAGSVYIYIYIYIYVCVCVCVITSHDTMQNGFALDFMQNWSQHCPMFQYSGITDNEINYIQNKTDKT